jgi:hypothetical protein
MMPVDPQFDVMIAMASWQVFQHQPPHPLLLLIPFYVRHYTSGDHLLHSELPLCYLDLGFQCSGS